jgi:hypothetical protein
MPPNPFTESGRRSEWQWTILLLLALVIRAGVLWHYGASLAVDDDNYRRIAERVVAGDGFVDPNTLSPTAYRPPLYPLLLAGILYCGGGNTAIGIVQLALGVATVALTVLCGCRLGLGRARFAAGLLVAVDPLLLYQTSLVMTETLATFLTVLLLWLCLGQPATFRNLAIGLTFGLCCLCRPTFWAFGVVAVVVGVFARGRTSKTAGAELAEGWRPVLCLVAGMVLVVAPWAIRNAAVMGRPIITTTHGGYTLLLPHNPAYTRAVVEQQWGAVWAGAAFDDWYEMLEADMAREVPPIDKSHLSAAVELARDDWMNRKARDYIRGEPVVAFKAGLTLLTRFWNIVPLVTRERPLPALVRLAIGSFYTLVLAAMLAGTIRVVRTEWYQWWPLPTLIVAFTLVHSLYWADMRMRTPLVPAIALLAAVNWPRGQGLCSHRKCF